MIEAHPRPVPGSERDTLVAASRDRIVRAQDAMTTALDGYLARLIGVVTSRLRGPRARKGTRWWGSSAKAMFTPTTDLETKDLRPLDPTYILPDKLIAEVGDVARPIALRVAYDAAAHTATTLGVRVPDDRGDGMFAIDHTALDQAVQDAIARILDVAEHHAAMVREAVTGADANAETLDEVLDQIEAAHRKGGNWVRMAGQSLTNGLMQDAALGQARALGVTHTQWLSRRDGHVRDSHALADGQVRPVGDRFQVGKFRLAHPCDPTDLPASWSEVANCRCGLLFRKPPEGNVRDLDIIARTRPGAPGPGVDALLRDAATGGAGATVVGAPSGVPVDAEGAVPQARQIVTAAPVVGYRGMAEPVDAIAGQWIMLAGPVVLGLAAPSVIAEGAPVLSVLIPAGTTLVVAGGVAVLPAGQPLEVLAAGPAGVQASLPAP